MAGEEESGALNEGESGTLAVSVVKTGDDEIVEGDESVSSGGTKELLSGGNGCAWGGEGSASVDEGDCGRGGASVLFNDELM